MILPKSYVFSPLHIGNGSCSIWYKPSVNSVTLNGADVSQINDLSGKGNHATQAVAADQALWVPSGPLNSQPCVEFDSSNSEWYGIDGHASSSNDFTLCAVFDFVSSGAQQYMLSGRKAGADLLFAPRGGFSKNEIYDSTAWRDLGALTSGAHIWTYTADSSGAPATASWLDRVSYGSAGYDGTGGWDAGTLKLGRWAASLSQFLNGKLYELILYESVLDANELDRLHRYMNGEYGL